MRDRTRCISWTKRTLRTSMHNHLRKHAEQEVLDEADGKAEASPVVPVLHNLQAVAIEVDITVEIHLMEGLHGNLVPAMVLRLVRRLLEGEIVLDRPAREPGLLVPPRGDGRDDEPESSQDRDAGEEAKEDGGLQATSQLPGQPYRHANKDGTEKREGEAIVSGAIGGQWGILDGGVLQRCAPMSVTGQLAQSK